MSLRLFLHTVRHLSATQVVARGRAVAKRKVRSLFGVRFTLPAAPPVAKHDPLAPRDADRKRGEAIASGRFAFVGVELAYADGDPDWHEKRASQLWRYHVHYFDYAADVDDLTFRRLVRSWLRDNVVMVGDGWHPYTVSLRIVNWCRRRASGIFDETFRAEVAAAIYGQARFLYANLETDVRGNHLLENLRALIVAGITFEGSEAAGWLTRAIELLEHEVAEQILADGCHFERVPGYHRTVLDCLADVAEVLRKNRTVPSWLDDAIDRMEKFLRVITGAAGRLPLFKDTTLTAGAVKTPISAMGPYFGASGYAVIRSASSLLVADFGQPCPPYLPAHAHADMFSFELTVDEEPVIVDSGVYEYAAGEWRDWFRSTAAHNTVEVEGENQSEVWASFRVGRRARAQNVRWIPDERVTVVQGEHDGYNRLPVRVRHRRTIACAAGLWLIVDELLGEGVVEARSRIHFHPAGGRGLHIVPFGVAEESRERGWYSERFGEKTQNEVAVFRVNGPMPMFFGYLLARSPAALFVSVEPGASRVTVAGAEAEFTLLVPHEAPPQIV